MKTIFNSLKKRFLIYLFVLITSIVVVNYVTNLIIRPDETEKLGIIVGTFDLNLNEEDIKTSDYIKEVSYQEIDETYLSTLISVKLSINNLDILILTESEIKNNYYNNYLLELDDDLIAGLFGEQEYYSNNDINYGIKCTDKLNKYLNGALQEDLYICLIKSSLHLGALNNQELDAAIVTLKWLIG